MAVGGQFNLVGTREPTSPAIPPAAEIVIKVRQSNKRTNKVRLLPKGNIKRKLRKLGEIYARAYNELNYMRRQQFFAGQKIDYKGTAKVIYEKYRGVLGSVNISQLINKNNEAWSSFFGLLKAKKQGKLPNWFKVKSPGYMKEDKKRKLIIVIRNDGYASELPDHTGRDRHGNNKRQSD